MSSHRPSRFLLLGLLICLVIRGGAILASKSAFVSDPDAYKAIASTISQHHVFGLTSSEGIPRAIAFRPPLYSWLLSFITVQQNVLHWWLAAFHIGLAMVTVALVFQLTRRFVLQSDPQQGLKADLFSLAAGVLVVIDPILLRQSLDVMTETLAATLSTICIVAWHRLHSDQQNSKTRTSAWAVVLGGTLALAYLCRPTFLVWSGLLVFALLVTKPLKKAFLSASIVAACVGLALVGWTMRNQVVTGHPVWATTHGGYTLLLGNNESFYDYLSGSQAGERNVGGAWDAANFINAYQHRYEGDPLEATFWSRSWPDPPKMPQSVTEYDDDRLAYRSAVSTIKRRPKLFAWSSLIRVARLWSPFPHDIEGRSRFAVVGVGMFYLVLATAVLVGILRHRHVLFEKRYWAIWLLAFTLTGVHSVYWSNMRMRAPIMPIAAMLAVVGFVRPRADEASGDGQGRD
ncbi:hypothetical protein LOC67_06280 [Stieleria sp. JC731]|uniref:ArnT family glycosyltransferase n=1 Tax=Pirellulaceae TaxID=2691357 RepID=UPI001E412B1E|nr:hypothetical protein [Stieleria sp. JC731]MCC9600160.1 hypothetical protein [Stieleria sp. JC731]